MNTYYAPVWVFIFGFYLLRPAQLSAQNPCSSNNLWFNGTFDASTDLLASGWNPACYPTENNYPTFVTAPPNGFYPGFMDHTITGSTFLWCDQTVTPCASVPEGSNVPFLSQTIETIPGHTYRFGTWSYMFCIGIGGQFGLAVDGNVMLTVNTDANAIPGCVPGWQYFSIEFTATGNSATFSIVDYAWNSFGWDFAFDDVEVLQLGLQFQLPAAAQTCVGNCANLQVQGNGAQFSWSTGETTASITVCPPQTTTYQVTVTGNVGCTGTASVVVTVQPLPQANLPDDHAICAGECETLTPQGVGFQWNTGATTSAITVCPSSTETYSLSVMDAFGCKNTDHVTIEVPPTPTVNLLSTACSPDLTTYSLLFSAIPVTNASASGGTTVNSGNGNFSVTGLIAGQNTLIAADNNGCTASLPVIAPDCNCPPVSAPVGSGDTTICSGVPIPTLSVTAQAGLTTDWYDAASGGNLLAHNTLSFVPYAGGTFFAQNQDAVNGCKSQSISISLIIRPLPVANAGLDAIICAGECTNLIASGGAEYTWDNGQNSAVISVCPAQNETYTLTVSDAFGCTDMDSLSVEVTPNPVLTLLSSDCAPDLTAYSIQFLANPAVSVSALGATVTDIGNGQFEASGIPAGQNSQIIANNNGCQTVLPVVAPDCNCPNIAPPISGGDLAICSGQAMPALNVTAQAGLTTDWYDAASGGNLLAQNTLSFVPNTGGTFFVQNQDAVNGCKSQSISISLIIRPLPMADAGLDTIICSGECTNLIASGGAEYTWNNGQNSAAISVCPAQNETYTLTVSDEYGCTDTDEVNIEVTPNPVLTLLSSNCTPDLTAYSIHFLATPAVAVSALGATVADIGNGQYEASGIPAGQNTQIIADNNGCLASLPVAAPDCNCPSIAPPVSVGDQAVCMGEALPTLQVAAMPNLATNWYSAALGGALLSQNTNTYTPTAAGIYFAENEQVVSGCVSIRVPVSLTILPLPVPIITSDTLICEGECTMLSGFGGNQYQWSQGANPLPGNASMAEACPAETQNFTLYVSNMEGCTASTAVTVRVDKYPVMEVLSNECDPDLLHYQLQIAAIPVDIFEISPAMAGNFTQNGTVWSIVNILPGTTISIKAINGAAGCALMLTPTPPDCSCPNVSPPLSTGDVYVCEGATVPPLSAMTDPNLQVNWYSAVAGGQPLAQNQLTFNALQSGTYYAEALDPINQCVSSRVPVIFLKQSFPNADAGQSLIIPCDQSTAMLDGSDSEAEQPMNLQWTTLNGHILTGEITLTPSVDASGTYVLRIVTEPAGCVDKDSVEVLRHYPPSASILVENPVCEGENGNLQIVDLTNGTAPFRYSMNGQGATDLPFFSDLVPGGYVLSVQDGEGCMWEDSAIIFAAPVHNILIDSIISLEFGEQTLISPQLDFPENAVDTLWWSPASGLSCVDCLEPTTTLFGRQNYQLTIIDTNGCEEQARVIVQVHKPHIYAPNAIKPTDVTAANGAFTLYSNTKSVEKVELLQVFDRWGELVFENKDFQTNDPAVGWGGRFNGKAVQPGVYVWLANVLLVDGETVFLSGDVVVVVE